MNYKLELQTSGGNFEATVYSEYHESCIPHAVLNIVAAPCERPIEHMSPVCTDCVPMLLAEGLGDAPHELKTYKKMEGRGKDEAGGQLGGSKELSADDEEVMIRSESPFAEPGVVHSMTCIMSLVSRNPSGTGSRRVLWKPLIFSSVLLAHRCRRQQTRL